MCNPIISFSHLDQEIKSWGSFSLKNALLASSRPSFFISKSDGLNTTNLQTTNKKKLCGNQKQRTTFHSRTSDCLYQVRKSRVLYDVLELLSMSSANQHDSPFSNGTTCKRFRFCADLINYNHLRHMVLHRLDHHFMLQRRLRHLHSTRTSNS